MYKLLNDTVRLICSLVDSNIGKQSFCTFKFRRYNLSWNLNNDNISELSNINRDFVNIHFYSNLANITSEYHVMENQYACIKRLKKKMKDNHNFIKIDFNSKKDFNVLFIKYMKRNIIKSDLDHENHVFFFGDGVFIDNLGFYTFINKYLVQDFIIEECKDIRKCEETIKWENLNFNEKHIFVTCYKIRIILFTWEFVIYVKDYEKFLKDYNLSDYYFGFITKEKTRHVNKI